MKYLVMFLILWIEAAAAQPHIAIRGNLPLEFGNVYQGGTATRAVTIVNEGEDTLTIDQVDTPCHCTSTLLQRRRIAPKDSSLLMITLNTREFIDTVKKYIIIVSNDPQRNTFIYYSANVISLLRISPQSVSFGIVNVGKPVSRTVNLKNMSKDTLVIRNVVTPVPYLEASFSPTVLQPGKSAKLALTFTAPEEKSYGDIVEIELNSVNQSHAYFWFFARRAR
jgi:hypothetical protein